MMYDRLRRVVDAAMAGGGLVVLAPVLVLIWVAVRLDSPGPGMFSQPRVGRQQRVFQLFKFRTMIHRDPASIDQVAEGAITGDTDHRITRIGRVLRRASLDELPQLWNVLRGDMGLIGPRPVLLEQLRAMRPDDGKRFEVRPGVTGLAQVAGRQELPWPRKLQLDAEYVSNRGARLDLEIFVKTIGVWFSGRGTYYQAPEDNWRAYIRADSDG